MFRSSLVLAFETRDTESESSESDIVSQKILHRCLAPSEVETSKYCWCQDYIECIGLVKEISDLTHNSRNRGADSPIDEVLGTPPFSESKPF